jgi:pilus assembly protein CpaE
VSSSIAVTVFGRPDRQLGEMLGVSGARLQSQPLDGLAALAASAAAPLPDVVIVDLRTETILPGSVALLRRQHPNVGVVILASTLDPTLMLEAMRAGVHEFLAEPVTANALVAAVRRVMVQPVTSVPEGQVFAFVGAKGGVGTTTVAVNVATALSQVARGKSLLVDLHVAHGDAALFLGVEPRFTTADALENIHRMDQAYLGGLVTTAKGGLHLLASAERPVAPVGDPVKVRELVAFGAHHYRYVVLDVPRSDMTMLDSLELASSIIVVANQELATVRRAGALAQTLRQRYGKDRVGVVMNRYDRRAEIGQEDVERAIGGPIRHLIPSDYRVALDGLNKGQPVVVENHNQLAGSFTSLARLLAGLEPATAAREERSARLFGRLGMARS